MTHAEIVKAIERVLAFSKRVDYFKITEAAVSNENALIVRYRCGAPYYKIIGEAIAEAVRGDYELRMTSRYHDQTMFAYIKKNE